MSDPQPWVVHYGLGYGDERYAEWVPGAEWKPRAPTPKRRRGAKSWLLVVLCVAAVVIALACIQFLLGGAW